MNKNTISLLISLLIVFCASAQISTRQQIKIPDIKGFYTMKCDLHIHTMFSDGAVWPDVRVLEARDEGLDAIAITDHLEYKPHKDELSNADLNHSYDLAVKAAEKSNLIVIRGAEITRKMPPGHACALFIQDANTVYNKDLMESYREARRQGAFIVWNHPCWKAQQPDTVKWFAEHTRLYNEGLMQGIEVVNSTDYCPEAFRWALEKKLAIMGNSDTHDPIFEEYLVGCGKHRPITLVFASEKTREGIKNALIAGRTAVWFNDTIYGREEYLKALWESCVKEQGNMASANDSMLSFTLVNNSDIHFILKLKIPNRLYRAPETIDIAARGTTLVRLPFVNNGRKAAKPEPVIYNVLNALIGEDKCMEVEVNQ